MRHALKLFFKNHVQRGSLLWQWLRELDSISRKFERLKSEAAILALPFERISNLNQFEAKIYSQNGEDGILKAIFRKIATTNKYFVEFGVENARECNTRYLREKQGWTGLWMDPGDYDVPSIMHEFVTAENINELFRKYQVPREFDLLSIDIDGNDYWVWKALDSVYTPRVVVIEYNSNVPPMESKVMPYDADFRWDGTDFYGASLSALVKLGRSKGYTLVGTDREGVNAFFVKNDIANAYFDPKDIQALYHKPGYGHTPGQTGWPRSPKSMIPV